MLLNIIKGPRTFAEIKTINGITFSTFKDACYALGLLESDKEWHDAIEEASHWSTSHQLRELFVTLLLFCEVSNPSLLWEKNWSQLADDILYRQRCLLGLDDMLLSDSQIKNYTLYEIEIFLEKNDRSLKEFPTLLFPDLALIRETNNRLIAEELNYDMQALAIEHRQLYASLNVEQLNVYTAVLQSVYNNAAAFFFVYGNGGTGKTFLWRTIIA